MKNYVENRGESTVCQKVVIRILSQSFLYYSWYPDINQIEFAYILNSKGKMKIEPQKKINFFTKNIFFY
ncbi:hypothetical protein EFL02_06030 [Enterococcus faecium]|nr:hypothetical protein [Enterococcus faecium]EGP5248624.1 hypothetical protein [Enterococcus faecium]EGP5393266.1 hypothetical protein [Enterococcus faecium]